MKNEEEIVIEKYLQSILRPFNIMQALFFCAKYKFDEDLITQNSLSYYVSAAFGTAVYISGSSFVLFASLTEKDPNVIYFGKINDLVIFVTGILLDYYTNVMEKTNNVLLVSGIQNAHRILNINGKIFIRFIIHNWIYVIVLNCFHIFWIFYYCSIFTINLFGILDSCLHICFDINVVYAATVMKLNYKTVTVWIANVQEPRCNEDESFWNNYYKAYVEILKSYQLIEIISQKQILFYNLYIFSNGMMDLVIHIQTSRITMDGKALFCLQVLVSQFWLIKSIIIQIYLGVECESFYSVMQEVQRTCARLETSRDISVVQKRVCKNINRLQKACFKKMNVCGLFTIDAAQPLHFFSLITTYVVVLLLFSFSL